MLQGFKVGLSDSSDLINALKSVISEKRDLVEVWHRKWYAKALNLAGIVNVTKEKLVFGNRIKVIFL